MQEKDYQLVEAQKTWVVEESSTPALQELPADVVMELYPEYDDGPCYARRLEFQWLVNKIETVMKITEVPFETDLNFQAEWEKFLLPILRADVRPLNITQINFQSVIDILRFAPMSGLTREREPFALKWVEEKSRIPFSLWTNKWKGRVQVEGVLSITMTLYLLVIDPTLGSNVFLPASIQQAQEAYNELLAKFEALEEPPAWQARETRLWEPKPVTL